MKTAIILNNLKKYNYLSLQLLYEITNANTSEEKHTIRGILSTLHNSGRIKNLERGVWAFIKIKN